MKRINQRMKRSWVHDKEEEEKKLMEKEEFEVKNLVEIFYTI